MQNMYSGSDSTESQKYPQWAMNPAAYQNMSSDEVDWAALAQQWIIMKEAGPPPIPGEQPVVLNEKYSKDTTEGGEAPMEMENEKEEAHSWNVSEPPPPPGAEPWNWNAQSQNWNWNNSWAPPSAVPPPPPNIGPLKPPLLPTPNNMYNAPPDTTNDNATPFGGYNSSSNNEYNSNYWAGSSHKHIKPHNKRYSKVNVPIRATPPVPPVALPVETVDMPTLDAAKRKQLPAWIREGLEKMEKDKLKQLEREREKQERDEYIEKNKQNEKETMEILKSTIRERRRSKFESDGENSDDGDVRKRSSTPEHVPLTPDELMLKVRRLMTEVLLNVTSRHIEGICKEEHQRYMKKHKASDQRSSAPSGANISARLGLGIYGDGSGSSSDEDSTDLHHDSRDSDTELKDTIKRRMAEFQKTEREIEDRLEEAERKKMGTETRSPSPESNDNDSQVDARAQDRRRHSDEKSSPRSKPKARSYSSSSDESDYSNNRSKNSRRSSSSDSNDSRKRHKKKNRSRSSSQSPDKKHNKSSLSTRRSRSKSPPKRHSRSDSRSRRDSNNSKKKSKRSRSRSYSRSRRSRSSSYTRSKRSRSRDRARRTRSRSRTRYSKRSRSRSRSDSRWSRRRRSRSVSSGRGKRSHRN